MRRKTLFSVALLAAALLFASCTYNRPVTLAPPESIASYLAAHHPSDVLVTDTSGRARWVHDPRLDGDTICGSHYHDFTRPRVAIPVDVIRSLATPHFSLGRTLGLLGAVLGTAAAALLIITSNTHISY
jgi:hypothetical protein